jgi:hypothetical protein
MSDGLTIALLGGAGMMGQGIVRDLLSDRAIVPLKELRVHDASRARMEELRALFPGDARLTVHDLDVRDPAQLHSAVHGADLCLNAVPTLLGHQMAIFEAALDARVDYMDLGGLGTFTVKQMAWHERFREAGVQAVLGCGSDPGMSNVLCRAVADRLDEIDAIRLYWAAELVGPENPVLVPPYSVSTVLAEYAAPRRSSWKAAHVECRPCRAANGSTFRAPGALRVHALAPIRAAHRSPSPKASREGHQGVHLEAPPSPPRARGLVGPRQGGFRCFDRPVTVDGRRCRPSGPRGADPPLTSRSARRHPRAGQPRDPLRRRPGRVGGRPATARAEVGDPPDPALRRLRGRRHLHERLHRRADDAPGGPAARASARPKAPSTPPPTSPNAKSAASPSRIPCTSRSRLMREGPPSSSTGRGAARPRRLPRRAWTRDRARPAPGAAAGHGRGRGGRRPRRPAAPSTQGPGRA